ncbi:uncharacterized protein [Macrobrachium rosenbergii]|uniref:uncharacterized protein isoform X2 n=1 Tax=Macrobrachium rosenbergii TaxID=79674 RepID=UPI0034D50478
MDPEGKGPQGSYSMQDFLLSSEEEQLKFLLLLNPSHVSKTADKKQLWAVQLRRFLKVVAFFGEAAARLTLESKMLGREEQEPEAEQEQEEGEGEEEEEITSLKEIDLIKTLGREEQEPEAEQEKGEREEEEEEEIISLEEIDVRALEILSRLVKEWEIKRMEYFFKKKSKDKDVPDISSGVLEAEEARLDGDGPSPAAERQEGKEEATADLPEKASRFLDDTERRGKDDQRQRWLPASVPTRIQEPTDTHSTPVKLTEEYDKPVPKPNFGCLYSEMFREDPKPYSKLLLPRNTHAHSLSPKLSPSTSTSSNDNIVRTPNSVSPYKPAVSDDIISGKPSNSGFPPYKPTSSSGIIEKAPSNSGFPPYNSTSSSGIIEKTPSNSGFPPYKPTSSSGIIEKTPSNSGFPPYNSTSSSGIIEKAPSNSGFPPYNSTSSSGIIEKAPSNSGFPPYNSTSFSGIIEKAPSNSGFPPYNSTSSSGIIEKAPSNSGFPPYNSTSSSGIIEKAPSNSGFPPYNSTSFSGIIEKTPSNFGFPPYKPTSSSGIIEKTPSNSGFPPYNSTSSSGIIEKTPSNSGFPPYKPTSSSGIIEKTPSNSGFPPYNSTLSSGIIEKTPSNSGFPPYNSTYSNSNFSGKPNDSAFLHRTPISSHDSFTNSFFKLLGIPVNNRASRTPLIPHSYTNLFSTDIFSREPSSPIYGGSTTSHSRAPCEAVPRSTPKGHCDIPMPPATNGQYIFIPEHTRRAHKVSGYYRKDGTYVQGYERGPCVVKAHLRKKN